MTFRPFFVDGWEIRPDLNTLTNAERVVRVEPRVMELFVYLARSSGVVVTKAELLEAVWPGVTVGEDSLTRAMSELRRALGDDARRPRVIETIPKRGYRLIAPVEFVTDERERSSESAASVLPAVSPALSGPAFWPGFAPAVRIGLAAALLTGLVLWAAWPIRPSGGLETPALVLLGPLQNDTGDLALTQTVAALVQQEIARRDRLALVPQPRLSAGLRRMRRAETELTDIAIALELMERDAGIAALVTGRIARVADELLLVLEASDAEGRPIRNWSVQGRDERALGAALASLDGLEALAAGRPIWGQPLPPVTTSSLPALRLFAAAVGAASANWASVDGPWEPVQAQLREALRLDPDFATARVWLAMIVRTADLSRLASRGGTPLPPSAYQRLAQESLEGTGKLPEAERLFVAGAALKLLDRVDESLAALETLTAADAGLFALPTRALLIELYTSKGQLEDAAEQAVAIAVLRPDDFDAAAMAGHHLVSLPDGLSRARPYVQQARRLLTPAGGQRENSTWLAAWVQHFDAFERWEAGDYSGTGEALETVRATLSRQSEYMRDSLATTNGLFWLMLGRSGEAREAFAMGAHAGQRELNLFKMAELRDDRQVMLAHLQAIPWDHDPTRYARLGLFDRARGIIASGYGDDRARQEVRAFELAAAGRLTEAIAEMQQVVNVQRTRPGRGFFESSIRLAEMWEAAGDEAQATRVLEEAAATRPGYTIPGPGGAWWIKVQVRLVGAYRRAGRMAEARATEAAVGRLLSIADTDHVFLGDLRAPVRSGGVAAPTDSGPSRASEADDQNSVRTSKPARR